MATEETSILSRLGSVGGMVSRPALLITLAAFLLAPLTPIGFLTTEIMIFAIAVIGFDILIGYTGYVSFGQAMFFGGGAYGLIAVAIPLAPAIGSALGTGGTLPLLGSVPPAYLPLVVFSGLLGVADSFREPASMALFADEGADDGGVASSFGIRELVWRPGSILGPLIAGWLMVEVSMAAVFYVGGAFALTGVGAFLAVLVVDHGRRALTAW